MTERKTADQSRTDDTGRGPLPPPRVGGETLHMSDTDHPAPVEDPSRRDADPTVDTGVDRGIDTDRGVMTAPRPTPVLSAQPLAVPDEADLESAVSGRTSLGGGRSTRVADRVFAGLSSGSAIIVIGIVVLVAVFLIQSSVGSIADDKVNFLTSTAWSPNPGNLRFGVANLLWVTVIISVIAMILAVPVAIGIALFITHYAPRRMANPVAYVIDLLAAIPSIVYGIWGYTTLAPALAPVQRVLYHLGGFPIFADRGHDTRSIFDGGVVLAVMVLPIITAISRDVFSRTPRANIEAALALGATKWEMVRMAVLPYGRPGVVSGAMLGLGRALGETIAVYLILTSTSQFSFSIFDGGETIASKIANGSSEFNNPASTGAYIAAGLVLFVLTFVVNAAARAIVNRKKDFR